MTALFRSHSIAGIWYSLLLWHIGITFNYLFRNLNTLIFENCSFYNDEELSEENLEIKNCKVPLLLELRVFKVISSMPTNLVFMILRKSLNIQTIEVDGEVEMTDGDIIKLLRENSLSKMENLLVYASRLQFIISCIKDDKI